jgi:predicted CoA-binding protein
LSTRKSVEEFLARKYLAVVGVSRSGKDFSNAAYRELKQKGYRLVPVNPHADSLEGERCYHRLGDIPDKPEGALVITNSSQTESVVRDAADAGIRSLWIQQGCQSAGALELARQKGLSVVSGECILMFAEPVGSFHRFHRWVWKLLGKLPK